MRTVQNAKVGDTVRVDFNIVEEGVERRQSFEGILMKVRGTGASQTITVRRISFGVGVERIFPVASPRFLNLKVIREGRARRSKLYYLRGLSGKAHRVESNAISSATQNPAIAEPSASNPEAEKAVQSASA